MSKFAGAQFAALLVDGFDLVPSTSEAVSMGKESITQQTNPFGAESEQFTPVGIEKGMLTIGAGFFDASLDTLYNAIGTIVGVQRIICAAIGGNLAGKPFMGFAGAYSQKYEAMDKRDGLVQASVGFQVSGVIEEGVIVQNLAAFTADWDTKTGGANAPDAPVDYTLDPSQKVMALTSCTQANPTVFTMPTVHGVIQKHGMITGQIALISGVAGASPSVNGSHAITRIDDSHFSIAVDTSAGSGGTGGTFVRASSVAGGSAYLQVNACSGFSGVVNKLMHSPDDITYAALTTFTTVTGRTKERKTVAGTIDRYLSHNGDVTGSGSIRLFSGFCRN